MYSLNVTSLNKQKMLSAEIAMTFLFTTNEKLLWIEGARGEDLSGFLHYTN